MNGTILGIQQFRLSAIISIVIWLTYYFGALGFAVFLRSVDTIVFGWLIGISLGVVTELIVVLSSVKKYLGGGKPPSSTYIVRYSFPILLTGIISYGAAYADRFIVSGLLNLSALGVYNFSLLIASAIGFMSIPFNNILMPKFSEMFGKNEKEMIALIVGVSSTLLSYFYVPSALGIAALAPMILNLLGGGAYVMGADPLRIVMFFTAIFITQNIITVSLPDEVVFPSYPAHSARRKICKILVNQCIGDFPERCRWVPALEPCDDPLVILPHGNGVEPPVQDR